jgi:hypothetical protein
MTPNPELGFFEPKKTKPVQASSNGQRTNQPTLWDSRASFGDAKTDARGFFSSSFAWFSPSPWLISRIKKKR